jgi:hypothetical protein
MATKKTNGIPTKKANCVPVDDVFTTAETKALVTSFMQVEAPDILEHVADRVEMVATMDARGEATRRLLMGEYMTAVAAAVAEVIAAEIAGHDKKTTRKRKKS